MEVCKEILVNTVERLDRLVHNKVKLSPNEMVTQSIYVLESWVSPAKQGEIT